VLNGQLEKSNFVTADWDVATQNTPPEVEDAARQIYVVLPPEPPPQPNPMQPSPQAGISDEQKQAITRAVTESGLAIFLTGWSQPTGRFARTGPPYEFADYLKSTWGIDVRDQYLVLQFAETSQGQGLKGPANPRNPLILTTDVIRFTRHKIAEPLRSLEGAFHAAAPLEIVSGEDRPADVNVEVIAEVSATEDVWAVADVMRLQQELREQFGTTIHDDDIASPFAVAAAATRGPDQKVVVFGSELFAADDIAQSRSLAFTGAGLQAIQNFPANTDLFINTLHWLTGEADRIAVGPRQSDVPRLEKLTEGGTAVFCRVFLVGIWPGLALLAGAGMWLLRRR
jgi:hypothetical protein